MDLTQRFHDAFNARDIETLLALMRPDVEYVPLMARLEGTVHSGHEAVLNWLEGLDRDWAEFRTEPHEFRDLGDVVLTLGTWHARTRTDGVVLTGQPAAWVTRIVEGQVARHETFSDRQQALAAVGSAS